ncbi:MAG TPA: hypothetical protein VHL77_12830 [Ferruginibacter sp.]|nr:hypothetical protein [Ferruginibacter sp.]
MLFLTHANRQNVVDAEAKISANCHFPNGRGTNKWANVFYNEPLEVYYILKPPVEGWRDEYMAERGEIFTQAQMMDGVTGVEEQDWE